MSKFAVKVAKLCKVVKLLSALIPTCLAVLERSAKKSAKFNLIIRRGANRHSCARHTYL